MNGSSIGEEHLSIVGFASQYLDGLRSCLDEIASDDVEAVVSAIYEAYEAGRQVFIVGNGGSAATASHMACDLGKTAAVEGRARLRVFSLTDNVPLMTAIANDIGYDRLFVEQLRNLLNPDDLVIVVTGSGDSPNVVQAARYAKEKGAVTVGLLGFGGGAVRTIVDYHVTISSTHYGHVEDVHMVLNHIISSSFRERILATSP